MAALSFAPRRHSGEEPRSWPRQRQHAARETGDQHGRGASRDGRQTSTISPFGAIIRPIMTSLRGASVHPPVPALLVETDQRKPIQ
jgi:hypothetical protein